MPAKVEKLLDEPIILVTIEGYLDASMMKIAYEQIAAIADQVEPPLYRITDARKQENSFADMMAIIKQAKTGVPGSTTDPRIKHVFVGRNKMSMIARDVYTRGGDDQDAMPMFDTIEDALTYIRIELAKA
jgi:hypothetical protein